MKRLIIPIFIITLCSLLGACSEDVDFTISGRIEGASAQSVTLTYFAAGGLRTETHSAVDGAFAFRGVSKQPTLAVVTVAPENIRIATLIVSNGDEIKITANLENSLMTKVKGNSDSEKIARWTAENAEIIQRADPAEINAAVSDYVTRNKSALSSAAILSTYFIADGADGAARADSLTQLLGRDLKTNQLMHGFATVITAFRAAQNTDPVPFLALYSTSDSIIHINPLHHSATLLCFLDADRRSRDSVVPYLHRLADSTAFSRFAAVEISTAPDSASWRASLGTDSVCWAQTWVQGSVAAAPIRTLAIRRIPYFIAADSAGRVLYRGSLISAAAAAIEERLK